MPKVTVAGRSFEVNATLGLLRRIKTVHGVDLLARDVKGLVSFLSSADECFAIGCEFLGLKTEAEQNELADQATGADVAAVIGAVTEALKDFFHGRGEPEMVAAIEKQVATIQGSRQALADKIEATDLQSQITKEILSLDLTLGKPFGISPDG